MKYETVHHTLAPVFSPESEILILGSMPSPKSREVRFYYGHPQNRFWRVLAAVYGQSVPQDNTAKTEFLLQHNIALWDVLARCDICGASDSSIKNPVPNDIAGLLAQTKITTIYTTGQTAYRLYRKLCEPSVGVPAVLLPSTSPANAGMSLEKLIAEYQKIRLQ